MSYVHCVKLIFVALLFAVCVNNNPFQSWVRVTPCTDTTSVITIAHDAYDLLCDTAFIVHISSREHELQGINIVTARLC